MTREALRLLDLPWDLVLDILSRVPATSLGRLSFTCKRWNALFKDDEFIKKHLDKAAKQRMVLMSRDSKKFYSMNVNLDGIHHDNFVDPQTKLLNLKDFHCPEQFKIYNISHCNGLLLCRTWEKRLVVWNPCTGQIRWIPFTGLYKDHSEFALGYENNNKSCQTYKILRCSWDFLAAEPQDVDSGIYDFESHSWKDLNDVFPNNCRRIISKAVSLKGNIYWIANIDDEEDVLLSFDFSTEKFTCLSIRFSSGHHDFIPTTLSVVREERLAVLYSSFSHPPKIEIWMTTTHDKIDQARLVSWSKFLSLELDEYNPQMDLSTDTTFFIDEEKKAAVLCDLEYIINKWEDMVYIVGEDNRFMKIPVGEHTFSLGPVIYNYVPSLVLIQQGGVMTRERKRKNRH
ncbi:putative F-box/kelch-repeat protein [Raphanus sativus]|uniref:F-box/kelch-repeat protein At3g17570 n=1 Tax=Raphanus sativus TaxID=3726 RepID=A0A6J0JAD9_RAPSA|nr:putative F-box/kelch-repeat protein At3g17570 [Raphanus sativus]KAJ4895382.1 putative F-box/kelch-repeat protein [Raphanus sativus]